MRCHFQVSECKLSAGPNPHLVAEGVCGCAGPHHHKNDLLVPGQRMCS